MTHYLRLKKPFVSHDTSGFSSLVLRQIPSLKFSPFPLALGIEIFDFLHDTIADHLGR